MEKPAQQYVAAGGWELELPCHKAGEYERMRCDRHLVRPYVAHDRRRGWRLVARRSSSCMLQDPDAPHLTSQCACQERRYGPNI
jgi:hypothetical protein